jgi:hypothetical protein
MPKPTHLLLKVSSAVAFCCLAALPAPVLARTQTTVIAVPSVKLLRDKSIAIALPVDGSYSSKIYAGSGDMTAQVLKAAFARYTNNVSILRDCHDIKCIQAASGFDYVVLPEILHWEDRNTEWSGKRDRVEIKIVVLDGTSKSEIASSIITGRSKWLTFGGDHPQDMLPEPVTEFVTSLY